MWSPFLFLEYCTVAPIGKQRFRKNSTQCGLSCCLLLLGLGLTSMSCHHLPGTLGQPNGNIHWNDRIKVGGLSTISWPPTTKSGGSADPPDPPGSAPMLLTSSIGHQATHTTLHLSVQNLPRSLSCTLLDAATYDSFNHSAADSNNRPNATTTHQLTAVEQHAPLQPPWLCQPGCWGLYRPTWWRQWHLLTIRL